MIVTNDSDLLEPIRIVGSELGLTVGVLNPHKNPTSKVLARHASFVRQILVRLHFVPRPSLHAV